MTNARSASVAGRIRNSNGPLGALYNPVMNIFLDHNATTPTRPEVVEAMVRCYAAGYANPASQHQPGQQSRRVLEEARQRVAEILGADLNRHKPDRLVFTSGGTEANNLAIFGMASRQRGADLQSAKGEAGWKPAPQDGRIVASSIEHSCVLEAAEHLLECGWRLDTLPVDGQGVVQPAALKVVVGRRRGRHKVGERDVGQSRDRRDPADRGTGGDLPRGGRADAY